MSSIGEVALWRAVIFQALKDAVHGAEDDVGAAREARAWLEGGRDLETVCDWALVGRWDVQQEYRRRLDPAFCSERPGRQPPTRAGRPPTKWPEELRIKIVGETLEPGVTCASVAAKYGLDRPRISAWRRQYADVLTHDQRGNAAVAA